MPRSNRLLLAAVLVTLAAGCGPQLRRPTVPDVVVREERLKQRELAISLYMQRFKRLYDVAARVKVASAGLCGDRIGYEHGFVAAAPVAFIENFRKAASHVLGGGKEVRVVHVAHGSAAEQAGLHEGDEIRQADHVPATPVQTPLDRSSKEILEYLSKRSERKEIRLLLRRGGETLERTVIGREACKYPVILVNADAVNASADGTNVNITSGMVRFVESDDELALVIGHELAHNMLGHLSRRRANTLAGTLLGLILDLGAVAAGVNTQGAGTRLGSQIGSVAFTKEFESEADYLGTYLVARAGYRIEGAPMFWRRMAVEHPGSIGDGAKSFVSTHPTTPERATALERTVEEIRNKIALGQPLVPERLHEETEAPARHEPTGRRRERPTCFARSASGVPASRREHAENGLSEGRPRTEVRRRELPAMACTGQPSLQP